MTSALDMKARYEANRKMLQSRRNRLAEIKRMYINSVVRRGALTYEQLSPAQLEEVRKEVREKIIARRRKAIVRTALLVLLTLCLIAGIIWLVLLYHDWFMNYRIFKRF